MNAHPQYEEDFELYELGVLDGSDKAEFETHLAGCAECRAKLAVGPKPACPARAGCPVSEPPPAVRERILEVVPSTRPQRRAKGAPPVPARRGLWTPVWAWAWAGVCLVLLVAAAWLARDNRRLSKRLAELELTHKQLEASSLDLKAAAARAQAVLDVLTGPQTVQVDLSPAAAHPVPHGKAFYNRDRGLLFYTTNLQLAPQRPHLRIVADPH